VYVTPKIQNLVIFAFFCTAWDSPECTNQSEIWHGFPRTCQIWSSLVTGWRGVGMGPPKNYNLERVSYPARFAATWQSFRFVVLTLHLDSRSRLSWPSISVWDYINILYTITLFLTAAGQVRSLTMWPDQILWWSSPGSSQVLLQPLAQHFWRPRQWLSLVHCTRHPSTGLSGGQRPIFLPVHHVHASMHTTHTACNNNILNCKIKQVIITSEKLTVIQTVWNTYFTQSHYIARKS